MFRVQLFGRDTVGKSFRCDLRPGFATFESAVAAAERAAANSGNTSLVTLTNYRITGISGVVLLDSGACGSNGRFTHRGAAA
jgi:hypothetical protein